MPMTLNEGRFAFSFPERAIKFDEEKIDGRKTFYAAPFQSCPGAKGVDFLAVSRKGVLMVEVKDCAGKERNNLWRILPNDKSADKKPKDSDTVNRHSLDIEIAQKVTMSLVCLYGAWRSADQRFSDYWESCITPGIQGGPPKLRVVLFLEGEFGSNSRTGQPDTRNRKQIVYDLKNSIEKKLKWLNCTVEVVNSDTYRAASGFTVALADS